MPARSTVGYQRHRPFVEVEDETAVMPVPRQPAHHGPRLGAAPQRFLAGAGTDPAKVSDEVLMCLFASRPR